MFGLRPTQLLLIVLIVANVAMLGVRWLEPSADAGRSRPASGSAPAAEPAEPGAAEPVAQVLLLSERPPERIAGAGPGAGEEPVAQPVAEPPAVVEAGQDEAAGVEPEPVAVEPPADEAGENPQAAAAALPERPVCRAWGPFNDPAEAQAVGAELGLAEEAYQVVDEEIAAAPEYLVYIDHGGNRETARRLLQELRTQDVEGYIMRGRFNDAISVGVFSQQARAARQQERVAALGYAARVEALERTRRVYYLAAPVPPSTIDRGGPNKDCSDIAPAGDIL